MLAELAAFNAAFSTVKQVLVNTGDFTRCVKQIGTMVGARADLETKISKRRNGFLAQLRSETQSDWEEFQALEDIRAAEEQLKQLIIYAGRPGLWTDWQRFQADARKERVRQKAEAEKRKEEILWWVAVLSAIAVVAAALVGFVWYLMVLKGM